MLLQLLGQGVGPGRADRLRNQSPGGQVDRHIMLESRERKINKERGPVTPQVHLQGPDTEGKGCMHLNSVVPSPTSIVSVPVSPGNLTHRLSGLSKSLPGDKFLIWPAFYCFLLPVRFLREILWQREGYKCLFGIVFTIGEAGLTRGAQPIARVSPRLTSPLFSVGLGIGTCMQRSLHLLLLEQPP